MQRIPRIVWLICAVLLVAAVLRLPYGYYNFLRNRDLWSRSAYSGCWPYGGDSAGHGVDGDFYSDRRAF